MYNKIMRLRRVEKLCCDIVTTLNRANLVGLTQILLTQHIGLLLKEPLQCQIGYATTANCPVC